MLSAYAQANTAGELRIWVGQFGCAAAPADPNAFPSSQKQRDLEVIWARR